MNTYWPTDAATLLLAAGWLVTALLLGYPITGVKSLRTARWLAWVSLAAHTLGIELLTRHDGAGVRMLAIIAVVLLSMKVIVAVEARHGSGVSLSLGRWLLFATTWFGMRPAIFGKPSSESRSGNRDLVLHGFRCAVAGTVLIAAARGIVVETNVAADRIDRAHAPLVVTATVLLLVGISLLVHFGLFNTLAGLLRGAGIRARSLFVAPLAATSLTEFWGKRWNLAFSEMTATAVFRPTRSLFGKRGAVTIAFLFSGLLHELAISLPVMAGWGLPMLYFSLHAGAMHLESRWSRAGRPIDASRWRGRLWTYLWLLLPLPMLFHVPFLRGCVWPLIGLTTGVSS